MKCSGPSVKGVLCVLYTRAKGVCCIVLQHFTTGSALQVLKVFLKVVMQVGTLKLAMQPQVVRAGGCDCICLIYIRLHEPEQCRCILEVVLILVMTVGASW